MKYTVIVLLLLTGAFAAKNSTYVLNTKRLDTATIAITCANGGDPTGNKISDTLIISCGK